MSQSTPALGSNNFFWALFAHRTAPSTVRHTSENVDAHLNTDLGITELALERRRLRRYARKALRAEAKTIQTNMHKGATQGTWT
jgi:hypothetical protein